MTKKQPNWPIFKTIPYTKEGIEALKTEFERLTKQRPEVVDRLQTAREMGDLSENGAYKAARWELGGIDRRLRELTKLIRLARPMNPTSIESASIGCKLTLKNSDQTLTFTLVSSHESNPQQQKLSDKSPIGQAVIGKQVGEQVYVSTPKGQQKFILTAITLV